MPTTPVLSPYLAITFPNDLYSAFLVINGRLKSDLTVQAYSSEPATAPALQLVIVADVTAVSASIDALAETILIAFPHFGQIELLSPKSETIMV